MVCGGKGRSGRALLGRMIVLVLFASLLGMVLGAQPARAVAIAPTEVVSPAPLAVDSPILIDGNLGFVLCGCLSSGTGTPSDPYLIDIGTIDISGGSQHGVEIRNTNASFILRGGTIHSGGSRNSGIVLLNVTNGRVENVVLDDNAIGIAVSSSSSIVITENTVSTNNVGIALAASSSVLVFHNDVITNADQASDDTSMNWDNGYPAGGNFWSDYNGWDDCRGPAQDDCSGGDGLGDFPYVIDGDSSDRYPLVPVNPPNAPPVAAFTVTPAAVQPGVAVTFDASGSADPEGYPLESYAWDFGDGTTGSGVQVQHAYSSDGTYLATLTVTDVRRATDSETHAVTVDGSAPTTQATLSGTGSGTPWYQSPVTVALQASVPNGVASTSYKIDMGSWQTYSSPFIVSDEGSRRVEFFSVDTLGNVEATQAVEFSIDTVPPSTTSTPSGTPGAEGWFVSVVTITLSAMDATSGVQTTQYRVDAGTWVTYGGAFDLADGAHTLEYYSTDVAGLQEAVHSEPVWVDTSAPVTLIDLNGTPGDGDWYLTPIEVTLSGVDPTSGVTSIFFNLDGAGYQTYAGPFMISGEGTHVLDVYSTDQAGHVEVPHNVTFGIDLVAPVTVATVNGTLGLNGWYVSVVRVNLTASDALTGVADIFYRIGSGTWTRYTVPLELRDGIFTVEFYSVDGAGYAEPVQSMRLYIDRIGPVAAISVNGTFGLNGWYVTPALVNLTAADGRSGVWNITYRLEEGEWQNYTGPFLIDHEGNYLLEVYATDVAGNVGGIQARIVRVDPNAPVTISSLEALEGANAWYLSTVRVLLVVYDNASRVALTQYRIDGSEWRNYTGPFTLFSDGPRLIEYASVDRAGNQEAIRSREIRIDRTAPTSVSTLFGTVGGEDWFVSPVVVNLTGSDAMSGLYRIVYRVDGGPWLFYNTEFTVLRTGAHLLEHYTTDWAGNQEVIQQVPFGIDYVPPVTTANLNGTLGAAGWYTSGVLVNFTFFDVDSGTAEISFRLDAGLWQVYEAPFVVTDGRHTLEYFAQDLANNLEAIRTLRFDVDMSRPVFGLASPSGVVPSGHVEIRWSASDNTSGLAGYFLQIDGGDTLSLGTSSSYLLSMPDGHHTAVIRAVDLAGNEASVELRFRVDTNVFSLTGPQGGAPTYLILVIGIAVLLLGTWRLGAGGKEAGPPLE